MVGCMTFTLDTRSWSRVCAKKQILRYVSQVTTGTVSKPQT